MTSFVRVREGRESDGGERNEGRSDKAFVRPESLSRASALLNQKRKRTHLGSLLDRLDVLRRIVPVHTDVLLRPLVRREQRVLTRVNLGTEVRPRQDRSELLLSVRRWLSVRRLGSSIGGLRSSVRGVALGGRRLGVSLGRGGVALRRRSVGVRRVGLRSAVWSRRRWVLACWRGSVQASRGRGVLACRRVLACGRGVLSTERRGVLLLRICEAGQLVREGGRRRRTAWLAWGRVLPCRRSVALLGRCAVRGLAVGLSRGSAVCGEVSTEEMGEGTGLTGSGGRGAGRGVLLLILALRGRRWRVVAHVSTRTGRREKARRLDDEPTPLPSPYTPPPSF